MTAAAEVQALLRFLTTDAKVPLADALTKIGALRKHGLSTPEAIAKVDVKEVASALGDDKISKQVANAAKRLTRSKKRAAETSNPPRTPKQARTDTVPEEDAESKLVLPATDILESQLAWFEIHTNRAPLFLAFAVTALKYTMPEQPLSSRLSLAQAVVSANSQSKAKAIGLVSGATAEAEGWADGQPKLRILNRDVAVLRRHAALPATERDYDSQETIKAEDNFTHDAFWGLDLEALRKSNGPLVAGRSAGAQGPPTYRPEAARAYLLKSMDFSETADSPSQVDAASSPKKKLTAAEMVARKEKAAAMMLLAIDLVCQSWTSTLPRDELDQRAWSWYVTVRPEVQQGQAGWGQKGTVRLADILKLRRGE